MLGDDALHQEVATHTRWNDAGAFTTLYVSGGPPSPPSKTIQRILSEIQSRNGLSSVEEITVEVPPATTTLGEYHQLRNSGVTRLSLKVFSLVSEDYKIFGPSHTLDDAITALQRTQKAGFETFSIDLSFGGAEHPLSNWKKSLHRAVEFGIPHITLRELDGGEGEALSSQARARKLAFTITFLRSKGYEQYELTHFARPHHRSAHQQNYYTHGNYLGLGPGAESFWWPQRNETTMAQRWSNVESPEAYRERLNQELSPVAEQHCLLRRELAEEFVLLRLRTKEGLDVEELRQRYGVDLRNRRSSTLDRLRREKLIHNDPRWVRLTDRGRLLTDAVTRRLLSEIRE